MSKEINMEKVINKYGLGLWYITLPLITGNIRGKLQVLVYPHKKYGDYYGYNLIKKYKSSRKTVDDEKERWITIPLK